MTPDSAREFDRPGVLFLAAATTGLFFAVQPVLSVLAGIVFPAMAQDRGWAAGTVPLAVFLAFLGVVIGTPLVGYLLKTRGARNTVTGYALAYPALLAAFALGGLSPPLFFGAVVLFGVVGAGTTAVAFLSLVPSWFERRLGLALGIALTGTGVGQSLLPPLVATVIGSAGWRGGFAVIALLHAVLVLPSLFLFFRSPERPRADTAATASEGATEGATISGALRTPAFCTMSVAFLLVSMVGAGTIIHLVPLATDRGLSPAAAARVLSVPGIAVIAVRPLAGALLDRLGGTAVAIASFMAAAVGCLLLPQASGFSELAFGAFLVGIGLGVEGDVMAFMARRVFGPRDYPAIYAAFGFVFALGPLLGPPILAVTRWHSGSYGAGLTIFGAAALLGSILILFGAGTSQARPPASIN